MPIWDNLVKEDSEIHDYHTKVEAIFPDLGFIIK
jgi:hypothetical protein